MKYRKAPEDHPLAILEVGKLRPYFISKGLLIPAAQREETAPDFWFPLATLRLQRSLAEKQALTRRHSKTIFEES